MQQTRGTFCCDHGPWRVGDFATCQVNVIGGLSQKITAAINQIDGGLNVTAGLGH